MATKHGRVSLAVYDNQGNRGSWMTHVNFDDGQTLAQANTYIGAAATAFSGVSTAGILSGSFDVLDFGVAAAPASDALLPSGAVFDFNNASVPTIYGNLVPSFLDSLVSPGGHIDITAGAALDWVNFMINSGAGAYAPANRDWIANLAGTRAFRSNRKSKKRIY